MKPWILSSQNLKNLKTYLKLFHLTLLKPHRLHHLLPLRPSLQKNLNLSGNIELLPESLLLQRNPEQTKDGRRRFLTALSAKDVELSDLDFGPQQELRSSPQARADFLEPHLSRSTSLRPWQGKLQKIDPTKKRPLTDLQQVETPTLEHPRALQHSHSDRHHGYQIEDIGIHDWQQSTPTYNSRTTSYRIYNEQPRLKYPSTWRTRTQRSTWTFHNYAAALPSLPDRRRSHHRCTSTQQSHCTKTMPPLWLPPPLQQEREELLPADPRFFIWVDQYPPVRLHSGWAYQVHQQLKSLPGNLSWHGPLHQQWADAPEFSLHLFHRCGLLAICSCFSA